MTCHGSTHYASANPSDIHHLKLLFFYVVYAGLRPDIL